MKKSRVELIKGDITSLEVDAIVNAANTTPFLEEVVLMEQFIKLPVLSFLKNVEILTDVKPVKSKITKGY